MYDVGLIIKHQRYRYLIDTSPWLSFIFIYYSKTKS